MPVRVRAGAALVAALALAGCETPKAVDGACIALRPRFPFVVQRQDTDATKREAYLLNTAYDTACGRPAP